MMEKWKKLMAAVCTASMLVTMPGMGVLADEMQEEYAESIVEIPEQVMEDAYVLDVEPEESEQVVPEPEVSEQLVGQGDVTVGDGVTATFNETTGAIEFFSDGGILWKNWFDAFDIDATNVKSIKVAEGTVYLPTDSELIFSVTYYDGQAGGINSSNIQMINLRGFDTSNVTDMSGMFSSCNKLESLDLSSFDTSNVTDMSGMFNECSKLKNLNLNSINTSNVTDMSGMFKGCSGLTSLDLRNFDTSNVIDMGGFYYGMFMGCSKLASIDLSRFNTSKVQDMSYMFSDCSKLTNLNLSRLDTSNVTDMAGMFANCRNMKNLNLSNFRTVNVTDMRSMFETCRSLTSLDLRNFNTSNVTDMTNMFHECISLKTLNLSSFDTTNVMSMYWMFYQCQSLSNLDVSSFDTSNVTTMYGMFDDCIGLGKLDISNFNTSNVESMGMMFAGCDNLTSLDLSNFDTSNVTDMGMMFAGCDNLTEIDVSGFDLSSIKHMDYMFYCCSSLATLDLSGAVLSNAIDTQDIIGGCYNLCLLKTPRKNSSSIQLPKTMYDTSGKAYSKLPILSKSITLTRKGGKFSDVQDPTHPYYKPIYWAAAAGITKGYSDGTFGINRSCTRGEMMMFLWRYAGKPAPKNVSKSPFKDVPKTHSFYKAILWGSQKGITKGYSDGTFGINRNVSRGECMMFLWRLKGKPAPKAVAKAPFPDVPKSHVFYNAVLWGYQKKITTGFTSGELKGKFGVNENCSRGQIVTFLYRSK